MDDKSKKLIKISLGLVLSLALISVVSIIMLTPIIGSANSAVDNMQALDLQKRINQLQQEQKNSEAKAKELKSGISNNKHMSQLTLSEIKKLEEEVGAINEDLANLALQIEEMQLVAELTELDLLEAEDRVAKRNTVLKARVRSMYEDGKVSYLEVLLGSTSFADFLNRFEALNLIVENDFKILKDNQRDREIVKDKKMELDQHLVYLDNLYEQTEESMNLLIEQERKQKVQLSSYEEDIKALERQLEAEEAAQKKLIADLNESLKQYQRIYAGTGVFGWPLDSLRMTSPYGNRVDPFGTGTIRWHNGVDFGASTGTPVYATDDGVIALSGWMSGYGWTIIIDHGSGITSLYAHNSQLVAQAGQSVKRGDIISKVGSTGNSTGPHLHLSVFESGKDVNPTKYVKW